MSFTSIFFALNLAAAVLVDGSALPNKPFNHLIEKRQSTANTTSLQVDLGYATYEGFHNSSSGLDQWKG